MSLQWPDHCKDSQNVICAILKQVRHTSSIHFRDTFNLSLKNILVLREIFEDA